MYRISHVCVVYLFYHERSSGLCCVTFPDEVVGEHAFTPFLVDSRRPQHRNGLLDAGAICVHTYLVLGYSFFLFFREKII